MTNRERIAQLQSERDDKIAVIQNEYGELLKPLFIDFTAESLNENGWVKKEFYNAGGDWIFSKGDSQIRVYPAGLISPCRVLTHGGPRCRAICDFEDLEYFRINKNYE